jgi:hypothetical protein
MNPILLILIVVLLFSLGGGAMNWGSPIGYGGISIGFILLIILIVLVLGGRL